MAISAKFQADYSSFLTATQAAEVKIRSFEEGAAKAGTAVQKMANSLSGTSIIQQATVMAEAVNRVGGVSKLTEQELSRVARTATEAANKLRAMGQDVPPSIQKIVDSAKNIGPALSMADKAAGLLKSTFGQFTAAGLATTAISKLTSEVSAFVATGLKLPAMEQSFNRLASSMRVDGQAMLTNMNTATRGLVSDFNLMQSANKAMLLGLPVTAASMGDLAKTATTLGKAMGQDATSSLNDLITALGRSSPMILDNLGLTVKVGEANEAYAAKLGKTSEQLTEAEKKMAFYEAAMEAARKKTAELGEQTKTLGEIAEAVWTRVGNIISATAAQINIGLGSALSSGRGFIDFLSDTIKVGGGAAVGLAALREQMKQLEAQRKASLGKDTDLSALEKKDAATKAVTASTKTQTAAVKELIALTPEQIKLNELLNQAKDHEKAAVEFAASSWRSWEQTVSTALKNVEKNSAALKLLTRDLSSIAPLIDASSAGNLAGVTLPKPKTDGSFLASLFGSSAEIGKSLSSSILAAIQGGGNPVSAAAGTVGTTVATNIANAVKKDGTKLFAGALGGIVSAAFPVVGSLLGPLVDKLFSAFDRNKGRDVVKDFAAGFGGFDALHRELNELGAEGEQLWIRLTQGVGRNNPEQARQAVDAVTAALERNKQKTTEAAEAAAAASQKQQQELDAISDKYSDVISKLESEYQSLSESIGREAEEEVMGIVETQERARRDEIAAAKAAQEAMRDAEIAAKKSTFDEILDQGAVLDGKLRGMFAKPLVIPYRFEQQGDVPGTSTYTGPARPPSPAAGGSSAGPTQITLVTQRGDVMWEWLMNEAGAYGTTR